MKATLLRFGEIEIDGRTYDHDVVIEHGHVRKRDKAASKPYRGRYGHTPLTMAEKLPWGGSRLIIGTGAEGALPVLADVEAEAIRRGIELVAVPTRQACRLVESMEPDDVHAVLHVTC